MIEHFYALLTFPFFKHLAHTWIFLISPSTSAFTVLKFGFQVRGDLLLIWERVILNLFPWIAVFSQILPWLNTPPIFLNKHDYKLVYHIILKKTRAFREKNYKNITS